MSEKTSELLVKAEDNLSMGDWRTAGILLHKILLQDFTNRKAWLLLQQLRSDRQPLEDFQQSFAQKYYPKQAHLLAQTATPDPAPKEVDTPPASIASAVPARMLFCPVCGAAILPKAKYCSFCGKPLSQDGEPVATSATPGAHPGERKQSPAEPESEAIASKATEYELRPSAIDWQPISIEALGTANDVPSESEKRRVTSELKELESIINKPQAQPSEAKPLTGELDRVLKRSTSPPRGTGSLDPNRIPPKRRPYCPTCRKLFEPEDLFCDICWAPLFQMVDKIPEEPVIKSQPAADTTYSSISPPATPPISEPEIPAPLLPEPETEVPAITPLEPEYDAIEDIRAAMMPESAAPPSSMSSPRTRKASSRRSTPRLIRWIDSLPPFVKGALMGMALIVIGICLGVIAYVGYQIWLG